MHERESSPVGVILCAQKDEAVAHYALEGLTNKVLAREYMNFCRASVSFGRRASRALLLLPTYSQPRRLGWKHRQIYYVSLASGGAAQAHATRRREPVSRECSTRPTGIGKINDFEAEVIVGKFV
jgi:hypothetical protein